MEAQVIPPSHKTRRDTKIEEKKNPRPLILKEKKNLWEIWGGGTKGQELLGVVLVLEWADRKEQSLYSRQ